MSRLPVLFRRPESLYWVVLFLIAAGLLVYSQTMAFVWDEGFHLVAAHMIANGKIPYIDFCFPQTLLNAYFNAAILLAFGETWHAVHAFDALAVVCAMFLTAEFVRRRFPDPLWRVPCAIAAAVLVGLDSVVVGFGPSAQAYGTGLLLCVVAFRLTVDAVHTSQPFLAASAGLVAGMAGGSTLLTAPLLPVLLIWMVVCNEGGRRSTKAAAYTAAAVIPFAPEIWLLLKAPQQTFFNVVQYQALFRRVNWGDATSHDFDVFTDWTVSAQTMLVGLLAIGGLLFIVKQSGWDRRVRREFYLSAWIALALAAYISTAHPTFGRYFIFMIPFVVILATSGLYVAGSRLLSARRPWWPVAVIGLVATASIAKYVFDDRDATNWHDYQQITNKIKQVTPAHALLMADEAVYFLLGQTPPSGMEFSYSHKLELPPAEEAKYHIISLAELKKQVQAGRFDTVETCKDEVMDDFKLDDVFPNKQEFDDCSVYWKGPKTVDVELPKKLQESKK